MSEVQLPFAVRALNAAGGALRRLGLPVVRLDEAGLFAAARRSTGLDDFGSELFREPLRIYLDALENEAHLTPLGRVIARRDVLRLLENRLHMEDEHRRHPEIVEGAIERPLVVIGLPRTGTTILHELLAQDPANRVPSSWEVMKPWPPPERATYDDDPRIAEVDAHFSGVDRLIPDFKKMHPMAARLPQECAAITAHDFASMIFHTAQRVPSYQAWLEKVDMRPYYASHRRQLQYLQWRCPGAPWVLKTPAYLWDLDALLAIHPDARLVQTHRDPLKVIASLTNLIATLRAMGSDAVDRKEIGEDWTRRLAAGLQKTMDLRQRGACAPGQVFDCHFQDLMRDEIGTVRRIYEHFGLSLGNEAEERMRRFLAANRADKHGRHLYTLEAAGLSEAFERARFAAYSEHFGVAEES